MSELGLEFQFQSPGDKARLVPNVVFE